MPPGVAIFCFGRIAWARWVQTENLPILEEHGGAETRLENEKPMVKPVSNLLRQLRLPRPRHFYVPPGRYIETIASLHCVWETVICFFHCQVVVESGSLFVSGRGCCRSRVKIFLAGRSSCPSCSLTAAHPPKVDPEACLVQTSDDVRLGPHHRPLS